MDKAYDFSFLDQESFRDKYAEGPNGMRFFVGGMSCSRCVRKLESLSENMVGVKSVRVDLGRSLLRAEIDPAQTSFSRLAKKIADLGFEPVPLAKEVAGDQQKRREERNELIRLGVAGACAGNIMTFSFATYLGDTAEFFALFAWLSFALYLPVVLYVAVPFYKGAIASLRQRRLSVDLPMAVASLTGFAFSTVQLLRGRDDIYFDSLSGFLFLILASRFAQRRMQARFLKPEDSTESLRLSRARQVQEGRWEWVPLDHLQPGHRILVHSGETVPADAELEGRYAHFSLAWLSGEFKAQTFLPGATVPAGARLTSGEARLIVRRRIGETQFGKILEQVEKADLSRIQTIHLTDRWAQRLLAVVFGAAVLFLVAYWPVSSEEAIRRALALIILACPCAMAFGTPLAFASALSRARRKGLVVRSARAFENAAKADTIFFDKTGTLTEADLTLIEEDPIPTHLQQLVLALENHSLHPIAFAFRAAFPVSGPLPQVDEFSEVPGEGVSGYIEGRFFELRRADDSSAEIGCTLYENRKPVARFRFAARLKPDSLQVLRALRGQGYKIKLLSGDQREPVMALAKNLSFDPADVHFGMSPADKAHLVSQTPGAIMVGDGVNDSLAMLQAGVGVSTCGGVEAALKSSDVYLTGPSLNGVFELIRISKSSLALVRQNLAISLIYNVSAGVLALLGLVNPFVAAILMPVSSGFILLSTWVRSRA